MNTENLSTAKENNSFRRNVLIVGGGPAGFATALILAKRGWTNITILEKRPAVDYYEPDKSFNYLIDGRGQKLTDFLGLTSKLSEISVPNTEFYLTTIQPNRKRKTLKLPTVDPNRKTAYWLPRRAFVLLLYQEIERNWQNYINIIFKSNCVQINKINIHDGSEYKIEVIAQQENSNTIKFEPNLLIGCDGLYSVVRNTLKQWDKSTSDKFEMKLFPSPSSGLKYKVLTLPPKFILDKNDNERAVSNMAYSIRGVLTGSKRSVSLGLLPLKNSDEPRSANVIRYPNHEIWKVKTKEGIYDFFEQAFPQLPIREIVFPEEAARFAKSEGGYFPIPQYCSGLHFLLNLEKTSKQVDNKSPVIGIVLLGDAIHCFPPDIGQGVNSALEDVCVLNDALSRSDDDMKVALPLYESLRLPDVKALVHLAQTAYPWQYNQDPLRKNLWSINFFLRLVLSRLLPYVFSPPAFLMIQNHQLSYQQIWSKVQHTTQILYVIGLILMFGYLTLVWKVTVIRY
ncbi:FAD-dependent monooxygenase [Aetokthonos hydrillicola Thurmond2011]|jgi:2-polyprenyl-6-methoxyphenol hydroxylase-like FAD-dependent oxidoreductase|uniref:FAD-dependent monooxygenase n=1 Tax=Aetokthonos hydrillicola Thurmond2011 TaxID=2712845 RepID=A0AAP5MAZ0_9CYAN|nr:NAD(P)/FAD-dependent oxidoreductase [Aetokthonos hydrillicola]MBO3461432.1 FAD-dependent monooxygenase [Aetokthonos hydrillicola CCALA 1050]MBW4588774.1 FAD-dependent monooxygenase [Aetokthonos hydrillicola CCALA 1050]MDR9897362.1 FAD-dependent monooxygenase [Aetokthonos hydrillicola Thurmond2011]